MKPKPSAQRPLHEPLRGLECRLGLSEGRIAELRQASEAAHEICADYEECCFKLLSLEQKGGADSRQAQDYREMRDQLERELKRHLERTTQAAGGPLEPEQPGNK